MTLPTYEVYAIKYAERATSSHGTFIFKDLHDAPMDMDYFVWAISGGDLEGLGFVPGRPAQPVALPEVMVLRVARLFRLARAVRLLVQFRILWRLVRAEHRQKRGASVVPQFSKGTHLY